ncbi:MAG: ATP synthase F1 subunit epsilon [Candidatus Moranbacteria bacterium]|nr:ATP synthase F1 subunit epsilon [Candidatus Moranbacteria bacterium]
MKKIKLKVATPERIIFEQEISQITLPTQEGIITILPDHIPLMSNLVSGVASFVEEGEVKEMAISGGFLELHSNELTILADTAERADEIDLERAEEARKRAIEQKQEQRKSFDENQFATVLSRIEKESARVKLAKRYQRRSKKRIHLNNH